MQRRNFLKSIGLVSAGLTLPMAGAFAIENNEFVPGKVSGKITCDGKGIEGVSVSDGFSVARTDKSGRYALTTHYDARFVFLSLPSGYEIPSQKGIASFYTRLERSDKPQEVNFQLKKIQHDDTNHTFIVWADTQIKTQEDAEKLKTISAPDTQKHIASLQAQHVFGIGCGDLIWDEFELFKDYRDAVATTGIPFWQVIGNHDMDYTARTDNDSQKSFENQFGPSYYSFNRGKVHYVILDDVFFVGAGHRYIGYITEAQLKWLERDLQHVPKGSRVVVALHIPSNTGAKKRNKLKEDEMGGTVTNREALYNILKPYKVTIVSGHTHWNEVWEKENIMEHNLGTVCGAWWSGPICGDGTPNGFGVFQVEGDDISWYYKSTGFEKDHQIRLYKPGADQEKAGSIIANVWNYDTQWQVEWWEDGKPMGAMERYTGYDPSAVELYLGKNLPASRKWIEPTLTDHLFSAVPSANAREVLVKAKDRFGNVYEERLALHA